MISAILGFSSLTSLYITYCDVRTFSFSLEHVHNWKPSPDIKVICALVCLVICYKKNEFVRSVCAVRHAVIHIDSCGCLSSGVKSWLFTMVKRQLTRHCMLAIFLPITTPYSPDLAPCDFLMFPKLKRPKKGQRFATIEEIKLHRCWSSRLYQKSAYQMIG